GPRGVRKKRGEAEARRSVGRPVGQEGLSVDVQTAVSAVVAGGTDGENAVRDCDGGAELNISGNIDRLLSCPCAGRIAPQIAEYVYETLSRRSDCQERLVGRVGTWCIWTPGFDGQRPAELISRRWKRRPELTQRRDGDR